MLEGLTTENFAMVIEGAKALDTLSQAAEWQDPVIPNADEYLTYTTEFRRHATELAAQAKKKNIEGATLAYVQMTMSCVNCHKYVRSAKGK